MELNDAKSKYLLKKRRTVYTVFNESLDKITRPDVGAPAEFIEKLQEKLDEKLENGNPPDTRTIDMGD